MNSHKIIGKKHSYRKKTPTPLQQQDPHILPLLGIRPPANIITLQRTIGNHATQRLLNNWQLAISSLLKPCSCKPSMSFSSFVPESRFFDTTGWLTVRFWMESLPLATQVVLSIGTQARVVEPQELRESRWQYLHEMMSIYT